MLSQEGSCGEGQASKPTLPGELGAELANVPLALGERGLAGVDGIAAGDQVMGMRRRGAEHELGLGLGDELHGPVTRREDCYWPRRIRSGILTLPLPTAIQSTV